MILNSFIATLEIIVGNPFVYVPTEFLENFRLEGAKKNYDLDAYTIRQYPKGHQKHMLYHSDWVYWYNWFSQSKKDRTKKKYPKGFIEPGRRAIEFK